MIPLFYFELVFVGLLFLSAKDIEERTIPHSWQIIFFGFCAILMGFFSPENLIPAAITTVLMFLVCALTKSGGADWKTVSSLAMLQGNFIVYAAVGLLLWMVIWKLFFHSAPNHWQTPGIPGLAIAWVIIPFL